MEKTLLEIPAPFRTVMGYNIFNHKYAHEGCETWEKLKLKE